MTQLCDKVAISLLLQSCRRGALTEAQKAQLGGWEIDANNVIIGERIAMGGFAEVFIGKFEVSSLSDPPPPALTMSCLQERQGH